MSSNTTYTFKGEDHTLGVIMQRELLKHTDTSFVAYKVPHPLYRSVEVRVQTITKPTRDVVDTALKNSIKTVDETNSALNKALSDWNKNRK